MKDDDRENHEADQLEVAARAMRAIDAIDVPVGVLRSTGRAMAEASRRCAWRINVPRGAAAALIAAALLGLAIGTTRTGASPAFAEVARRVSATKTLKAVVVDPREGGTLFVSGTRRRFESDGTVLVADSATGQEVMLDVKSKSAYRIPRRTGRALDFYGVFRELATAASAPIEPYVDKAGRRYAGLSGKAALKVDGKAAWKVSAKVWSDAATKLPVRLEIRPAEGGDRAAILIERIEFDLPLDDALFDMRVPAGYKVAGLSAGQLGPPPTKKEAAKLTLVPGVGVGDVKFGMSRRQVVAILGEPEFVMHEIYLCYPSKGLQLVLVGREPDRLGMIIANPGDAASLVRHDFLGQTDKGIRIGSSSREVVAAYGEPDPPLPGDKGAPHPKVARYGDLGMMFGFVDGKVGQITASRTK